MDGLRGRAWMSVFAFSMLSPIVMFVPFPTEPMFYMVGLVAGILMSYIGTGILNLSRRFGGPLTSLTRPIQILGSFLIWAMIEPAETIAILSHPVGLTGILLSFGFAAWGQWSMTKGNLALRQSIKTLLILGALASLMSPLTKLGMTYTFEFMHAYVWSWMMHLVSFNVCFLRHFLRKDREEWVNRDFLKGGFILGILKVLIGPMIITAYHLSPNPAFATLIFMLSTVWLMIFYKYKKAEAHVNLKTAALMILSAVIIIVSSNAYQFFDGN